MSDHHVTVVVEVEKLWGWECRCGAKGGHYPSRERAVSGARLHRIVKFLKFA